MSLHNDEGIAPDAGVTGPRDGAEQPENPKVPDAEANQPDEDPGNPVSVEESA